MKVPTRRIGKPLLIAAIALAALLLATLGWAAWEYHRFCRPAVAGMTQEEVLHAAAAFAAGAGREDVRRALGEPARVSTEARDQQRGSVERWRYNQGGWQFLDVFFDAKGRVVHVFCDG